MFTDDFEPCHVGHHDREDVIQQHSITTQIKNKKTNKQTNKQTNSWDKSLVPTKTKSNDQRFLKVKSLECRQLSSAPELFCGSVDATCGLKNTDWMETCHSKVWIHRPALTGPFWTLKLSINSRGINADSDRHQTCRLSADKLDCPFALVCRTQTILNEL